jgi:hypothetical protein
VVGVVEWGEPSSRTFLSPLFPAYDPGGATQSEREADWSRPGAGLEIAPGTEPERWIRLSEGVEPWHCGQIARDLLRDAREAADGTEGSLAAFLRAGTLLQRWAGAWEGRVSGGGRRAEGLRPAAGQDPLSWARGTFRWDVRFRAARAPLPSGRVPSSTEASGQGLELDGLPPSRLAHVVASGACPWEALGYGLVQIYDQMPWEGEWGRRPEPDETIQLMYEAHSLAWTESYQYRWHMAWLFVDTYCEQLLEAGLVARRGEEGKDVTVCPPLAAALAELPYEHPHAEAEAPAWSLSTIIRASRKGER